jgi:lipopolysaccharide/colanic/teichoic acid biosynthesis glycosyltransferase
MKWLFDKIVGSLALICAAPIMLMVAIAVKLDSKGPVLFKYQFHPSIREHWEA